MAAFNKFQIKKKMISRNYNQAINKPQTRNFLYAIRHIREHEVAIIFHSTLIGIYKYLIISRACEREREKITSLESEILNITILLRRVECSFCCASSCLLCAYRKIFIFKCVILNSYENVWWREEKKFTDKISFLHIRFSLPSNVLRVRSIAAIYP